MNYVGIDFSKNSTGVTLIKSDNSVHFFSFARDFIKDQHKKAFRHHVNIDTEISDCEIVDYQLLDTISKKEVYYVKEWNKLLNGENIATRITRALHMHLLTAEEWKDTQVAFEGYAFGAKGNVLLDLVTMTTLVKQKLTELTLKNIYVFAPTSIKSIATGNGRAGKDEMFQSFLGEPQLKSSPFRNYCSQVELDKKGLPPKPIDDIVDSWFVTRSLIRTLENI